MKHLERIRPGGGNLIPRWPLIERPLGLDVMPTLLLIYREESPPTDHDDYGRIKGVSDGRIPYEPFRDYANNTGLGRAVGTYALYEKWTDTPAYRIGTEMAARDAREAALLKLEIRKRELSTEPTLIVNGLRADIRTYQAGLDDWHDLPIKKK